SLYGSDALAGAIDLRTTDARFVESNTASSYIEGGSFDTFRGGGKVTIRDGRVGITLDGSFVDTRNDRVVSSNFENQTLRGNVAFEIADGIYLDILGSVQDAFLQVPGQRSVANVPRLAFPVDQTNANQSALFSPRISIIRDDWDFSTFYSYTENTLTDRDSPGFFGNIDSRLEQDGGEWESQFNYRPTDDVTLTIGGGHYEYRFERTPLVATALPAAEFEYSFTSVFAQADIALPANFHLLTSGRYDDHDTYDSRGTYTAQLSHLVEQTGTTLFGKVATGYKAPTGQDLLFTNNLTSASDLMPEESFTYEFGVSQSILGGDGVVSVTYFNNDIEGLIDNDPITFDAAQVDTETEGFEFELRVAATENLELYSNYTYLDANVAEGTYALADPAGSRLIRRPRHTLAAGLIYSADRWQVGAELNGAYDRVDRGPFPTQIDLGGYTVARFFGNVQVTDNFEVYGRIENAFDEQYDFSDGYEAPGIGAFIGARIYLGESSSAAAYTK
ncbi:MAG: TonB-dependent receptor, partial [Verrucomicrobiota bacterium]